MSAYDDFNDLYYKRYDFYPFDYENDIPCYFQRVTVTDDLDTRSKIITYIRLARKAVDRSVMFSITEQDKHHKLWLEYANERGFCVFESGSIHGDYKCWAIMCKGIKK